MNTKLLIAFAATAAYGLWYAAIGGRQITEGHVAALYRDYVSAFDRGDGKAVCDLFSDKVHGRFVSTSRTMPVKEVLDKAAACTAVDDFYRAKQQMEEAAGHELHTNFEYTLQSIDIAPDKKSARVQVRMEVRIGTERGALLDMRSTQTDIIQRRFGKAQFVQSDGSVSFYRQ